MQCTLHSDCKLYQGVSSLIFFFPFLSLFLFNYDDSLDSQG